MRPPHSTEVDIELESQSPELHSKLP